MSLRVRILVAAVLGLAIGLPIGLGIGSIDGDSLLYVLMALCVLAAVAFNVANRRRQLRN